MKQGSGRLNKQARCGTECRYPVLSMMFPVSLLLAPILLDAPNGVNTGSSVEQWVAQFSVASTQFLHVVDTAFRDIFRIAWITILSVGALLYLTRLHRKLGKDFVLSGIAMLVLVQFVFPFLSSL